MSRLPDWEPRLAVYLASARTAVRKGEQDYCALFSAGAVEVMTGDNPADAFRGHYREVADNLEMVISGLFAETRPGLAQRGDLAWHNDSVGVVIGGEALFVGHGNDLVRVPRHEWAKVWRV